VLLVQYLLISSYLAITLQDYDTTTINKYCNPLGVFGSFECRISNEGDDSKLELRAAVVVHLCDHNYSYGRHNYMVAEVDYDMHWTCQNQSINGHKYTEKNQ